MRLGIWFLDLIIIITYSRLAEKFEAQLIQLCHKFRFDIQNPKYKEFPLPNNCHPVSDNLKRSSLIPGKLERSVAEQLLHTLMVARNCRESIEGDIARLKETNKKAKPGPLKVPSFFAEQVLVGICLHRGSAAGLEMLRTFLEPGGELEKWLTKKLKENAASISAKKSVFSLLITANIERDINQWASIKRQTLENTLLEDKNSKRSMRWPGDDSERNSIREIIKKRADILRLSKQ